ncbi:pyridoxal phosphate-dependent decarboxylase family protein [Kineobactrum salinum]|uniref:Aspartate aminotransferase family protein n=1 Tax=Kineobactrum salinum TaxID=2708301 RepID=A0A6C0TXH5_9GAMM|nr:pyridoxal-dependent decarboxylase [Kineobactrum salinum]QIB64532.1 aspartate aminotransferase family protein [Kineobactrum salinum]
MTRLTEDLQQLDQLTARLSQWCQAFVQTLPDRGVAVPGDPALAADTLEDNGAGAAAAFDQFVRTIAPFLSASAGPRYLGFVTGGTTPAAMLADWLVAATDQNVSSPGDSISTAVELQVMRWLRALFVLPEHFEGLLTTGATASNLLGILCGRQFAGLQQNIDIAASGLAQTQIAVFSATAHASSIKSLSLAGLGRDRLTQIDCLPGTEAMDVASLRAALEASSCPGKIVLASAGTVTGTDFDDLQAIAALCRQHHAWLHVDGAFGLFSRLLPEYRHLSEGIELADSITSDAHKWLNVPYDCGIFFTRHTQLLQQTCSVAAPYLATGVDTQALMDWGIENSRRFRALPVWMTLKAYGRKGYRDLVAQNCHQAAHLADWIEASPDYQLLAPCKLNVVIFKPRVDDAEVGRTLRRINASGKVFMTPGFWQGSSGIRAAFSNWRTTQADMEIICDVLKAAMRE